MQHGEAQPEAVSPERELSPQGRLDVGRLADFLGGRGVRAARVYHSGKTRARETAEKVAAQIAVGVKVEATTGLNPNDPVEPIVKQIAGWREDTLIVGHMPFMGKLAAHLLTGNSGLQLVVFKPGSMLCLERDENGRWAMAWMLRPELLSGNL